MPRADPPTPESPRPPGPQLVAVTDHAADRYRQRIRGTLEAKAEIVARVAESRRRADRVEPGARGTLLVRDARNRDLVYVCRPDHDELVVVTVYEEGADAAVPRRFTDALHERARRVRGDRPG